MLVPAIEFFNRDIAFKHQINGLPSRLSDITGLTIGTFKTSDGVSLNYWKAGAGEPLVFVPGWSSCGAEYINLIYLLKEKFTVYVLDQRNHGLSEKVKFGNRIARFSMDLHEFLNTENIGRTHLCGWSMGCSVIWSYVELFGTHRVNKFVFIDQAPSVYCHSNWTEEERRQAGAFTASAEATIEMFYGRAMPNRFIVNTDLGVFKSITTPEFENSLAFCKEASPQDYAALEAVLYDHIKNDWREVIARKIDKPTLIVSGKNSDWADSQHWIADTVPHGEILMYGKHEHGDHFLHLKSPQRFAQELAGFLNRQ